MFRARMARIGCFLRHGAVLLSIVALAAVSSAAATPIATTSVTVAVGPYELTDVADGPTINIAGFGRVPAAGHPMLPSRIFAIAIPPGAEVIDVTYDSGEGVELPGSHCISPVPLPRVIGEENPAARELMERDYQSNYAAVYQSDAVFPRDPVEFVRTAGYRKYNLVDVRVTPFAYQPLFGKLVYYPDLTVNVRHTIPGPDVRPMVDNLPRTERVAAKMILNHTDAQQWYSDAGVRGRGLNDFVIITLDSLTNAVAPLVNWETLKGRNVEVVTTSWINANYTGYDLAAKMRAFLIEKYPAEQWGIEDVLLVGSYDDVPMRRTAQDVGYGEPETDFYYAELSQPDSASWDSDGDHLYGESTDTIDFYNEVIVGRIPWSDAGTVADICQRSIAYEQTDDPAYKKNILLLGGYFWDDTDNAELMEAKVNQSWMTDWTMTRMYEKNADYWSTFDCDYPLLHANVMAVWPTCQFAFVNWAGHGSPTSSHIYGLGAPAFISSSDCPSLSDDYPAIIFADACSNSDTDHLNIGQAMLQHGAVGFVGATKVAYGCGGWNSPYDGSSQSLDYFFTTCVTSGNYTQGQAHQWALREMYQSGLWYSTKYETFEWGALWGNPNLGMVAYDPPPLIITLPSGAPETMLPNTAITFDVQIASGMEDYASGSAVLNYRYDGGTFLTTPLTHVDGDLFQAELPAGGCSATPEFYISASGDGGSTVLEPAAAPDTAYVAAIGRLVTLMLDDFETDQGWLAENLGASSGLWARGTPVNDPSWDYDPAADADGSGQCFLTQNNLGNTDIDGGTVALTSPAMDLTGGGITISYDYYLYLTRDDEQTDHLIVEISGAGSAGPWTEIARHSSNGGVAWRSHSIDQAALDAAGVTLTSNMCVRFLANDADTQSIVEAGLDGFQVTSFTCQEEFELGDMDCDGTVDVFDIDAFVLA
ncbi:MAG: hypothetical protein JXO22_08045, partial [Phycisphaerae bacterium]|nr:hypothetical protein [Phycisphaerae bacterium]